jgi:Kef-type K+ transport system membrane component KefB
MAELHFTNLLIVVAAAFAVPLLLGLAPSIRLPAVVLEIVVGIVVGPSGLGWVEIDAPIAVLSLIGLAFLLFLAGLEVDFNRLRGRVLKVTGFGFLLSFAIAVVVGLGLKAGGFASKPLFAAIILSATSLGIIIPLLKDAHESGSTFGQLVIAAGSIADFGAVILLTLFFSREATGTGTKLLLLGSLLLLALLVGLFVLGAEHLRRIHDAVARLSNTTAQIRVRGAFVLMIAFAALAQGLGLEVILGTFIAGAILKLTDRDETMMHPELQQKLEAVGYGVFIPVFFVASGLRFDLNALFSSAGTVARVPIFLAALLVVRGLPALLYRKDLGARKTVIAALLQATSLPFIVAATMIGLDIGVITEANAAAFIAAGLLSVLIFPITALTLLRGAEKQPATGRQPALNTPAGAGTVHP